MKKLFAVLTLLLVMIFGIGAPQTAQAAFEEKPVGFVVIDKSGNLDMPTYKEWRTVTKWAYRFPNYKLVENGLPQEIVGNVLSDSLNTVPSGIAAQTSRNPNKVRVSQEGLTIGITICQNVLIAPAPSISDASNNASGRAPSIYCFIRKTPIVDEIYGSIITQYVSTIPSHE